MSIAIALGVTTPETSYADMAAGSDPESVEASPAVNEKAYSNHSCGNVQNHGYRGLPYADHNYGAPPPPTPPASPLSQTIIPRLELNGVARSGRYQSPHAHALSRPEQEHSADTETSSEEEEEEEESSVPSVWCHCSLTHDGFIKCENCRGLHRRKGLDGQNRKVENVSDGESSATESGDEEVSPSTVSYTATQHTPTSITLTVNRVKRTKTKKRKKSTDKSRTTAKTKKIKAFREGSRKSMRMKNSTMEASALEENAAEDWDTRIRQWTDQYEEALTNQYSADVQMMLQLAKPSSPAPAPTLDTINRTELACNNTVLSSQMQLQVGRVTRVQRHRKILRAARDLEPDTLIIEYRGKVMLKQQFEVNGHFFKKPYPFVLFYSKFNEVEMCVDARTFGNDARFIRRSCTPNAEVRHMISDGMIHLCIFAVTHISKDSEVTIGFDYQFNSCNYKVDCACHKGNQNCPVQKHNLRPMDTLISPPPPATSPAAISPQPLPGAETRRRRARRRELEGVAAPMRGGSDDSNLQPNGEMQERDQGPSDAEDSLLDGMKAEEGEEGELDDNGVLISSRRSQEERRRRRLGQAQVVADELKQEAGAPEEGEVTGLCPSGTNPTSSGGSAVGINTRRTSIPTEATDMEGKAMAVPAPPKPPARSTKPRPKSRISRYRSGSAQRARRQRQALAQQAAEAAAAAAAIAAGEDGAVMPGEQGPADGSVGAGQVQDGESQGGAGAGAQGNKANLRYPKTKKYLVTEWLNDKVPERGEPEAERPLRISTDPTVLATTLNMLPGLCHSSLICTAPKHYVRFGSPFTPERRRRPMAVDPAYGSCKKRWIKQALDESKSSLSLKDGVASSSSNRNLSAPFKKRKSKYTPELFTSAANSTDPSCADASNLLLRPLSPITPPPPPSEQVRSHWPPAALSTSCALYLGAEDDRQNGSWFPYSPLTSLSTSRCNTPLQFENISSPEASPVHQSESLQESPESCLQPDLDSIRTATFPDLSINSSLDSPNPMAEDYTSISPPPQPQTPTPVGSSGLGTAPSGGSIGGDSSSSTPTSTPGGPRQGEPQARDQAFRRTEFNLIYACSPLNANISNSGTTPSQTDKRHGQAEGGLSPAESYFGPVSSQGLHLETAPDSLSPYPETHYGSGYPDSGTPPHPSNPPQKKKVSLLEYRKRKQGAREPEVGGATGTPTRPGSLDPRAESPSRSRMLQQQLPSTSPRSSFSSPAHQAFPMIEDVSPPHSSSDPGSGLHEDPSWMRPTSVERLREGQGVLERVLRGSLKVERTLHRPDPSDHANTRDKDTDCLEVDRYDLTAASPIRSPQRYSPSVYKQQSHHHPELHLAPDTSASPFRSTYSPSPSAYSCSLPQASEHTLQKTSSTSSSSISSSSLESSGSGTSRPLGGATHQHISNSSGGVAGASSQPYCSSSHLKATLLNSSLSPAPTSNHPPMARSQSHSKLDSAHPTGGGLVGHGGSRQGQQGASHGLQTGSRLLATSGSQHYPPRGNSLSQFQHQPLQGSGVRTQTGSY